MRGANQLEGRLLQQATKIGTWPPVRPIVAEGLEVRGFVAGDIQPFYESIDDDVCYWQGYAPPNIAEYRSLLQLVIRLPDSVPPVRPLALICEGRFAGAYFLTPSIGWRDRWNVALGWWLAPEARGRGLGRASLAVVLAHVHRDLGLRVARMGTGVDNLRAVRQIEANEAVPVSEGPHRLPNGRVVTARWYHHEER